MKLRPYQQEVAKTVLDSVQNHRGLTFSVEIARQGGKNELSAHLELLLLTLYMARGGNLIKCSPTFKPQTIISMARLKDRLDDFGFDGLYRSQMGYIIQLGEAKAIFLSAEESSSVVGHTADILLEIDESQDVAKEKYNKEFRPMGSSTNVTCIHYGTTWDDSTLLEEIKQNNLELEKIDGIKRHFRYDWQEIARYNQDYGRYVIQEKERLGEDHPLFRTQYALLPIKGGGGFLSRQQIAQMLGSHQRLRSPDKAGALHIAGVDLAGEAAQEMSLLRGVCPERDSSVAFPSSSLPPAKAGAGLRLTPQNDKERRARNDKKGAGNDEGRSQDSTIITIAQVDMANKLPTLRIVEQYQWTGIAHSRLYPQMVQILKNIWNCHRIAVDATGIGQPVASFLRKELGSRVIPFTFTQKSKSELGFELLSYVNSNRVKLYQQDGSKEYQETMFQLEKAKAEYRPNQTVNFYVPSWQGHDDFLMSLALLVIAARNFQIRYAKGSTRD
jgi:hypothetical protein